jgi:hypothetical protein
MLLRGALAGLLFSSSVFAHTFMPPNNLHKQVVPQGSSMTEAEFGDIIDSVIDVYQADAAKFGAKIQANKLWDNNTVNASANQAGNVWHVNMYGGLARRPEVTPDGFALVVCHELGHHFAGFPHYVGRWASSEGESDYFATQACARRVWGSASETVEAVDPVAKQKCDLSWATAGERNLCYRIAMGGKSLAHLLSQLGGGGVPQFGTPDTRVVPKTSTSHPAGQCRLDTYFAGALCKAKFRVGFIPGKGNPNGQDSKYAEFEMLGGSCDNRPRCWYAPGSVAVSSGFPTEFYY